MWRPSRVFFMILLCAMLVLPIGVVQDASASTVPAPKLMGGVSALGIGGSKPAEVPGTWYVGATPPNADLSKPPIVFVQGKNGRAQDWWEETVYHGTNDMYATAYNYGYRTAFVQLYDAAGNGSANQWDNGQLLAQLLQQIYNYYGQKVNIVAHSKGGPDTQAALIHYNAYVYVNKVVTLSSPHHGSHLANLAYSWYAGWLAELLGEQDDGTYSLQTGEMERFRQQTDSHPNASKNKYYTSAGTSWGPFGTALWTGGLTLSAYGDNDGLVNVWSTYLPYGSHLFTINVDHDDIRKGSTSFWRIEPVLRTATITSSTASSTAQSAPVPMAAPDEQYLAGGALNANQQVEKTISIDSKEAFVQVMTKSPNAKVTLISPSGKEYNKKSSNYVSTKDREFFAGATIQGFHLKQAETGDWKVRIQSPSKDAYFLVTTFKGAQTLTLDLSNKAKTKALPLKLRFNQPNAYDLASMNVDVKVVTPDGKITKQMHSTGLQLKMKRDLSSLGGYVSQLPANAKPGLYNITIQVTGKTKAGKPFARTIVKSIYVGD